MPNLSDEIRPGLGNELDYVRLDKLRLKTGVSVFLLWSMLELLANALEKLDASEISVRVRREGPFDVLSVWDSGSKKIRGKDFKLILNFGIEASSKRGLPMVKLGTLGNALKCIFGLTYALATSQGLEPPESIVESGGWRRAFVLKPDWESGKVEHEYKEKPKRIKDDGFTKITVKLMRVGDGGGMSETELARIMSEKIEESRWMHRAKSISYELFGQKG